MKNITISRIEPTNPTIATYVDRIKGWDTEGTVQIEKENKIVPFYAIYFNAKFLAAGTIEFDRDSSRARVAMVNGSINHHDQIQEEASIEFSNIVANQYGINDIEFSYVKKKKIS